MPFKELDDQNWRRLFRRTAILGLPNAWKTTSIYRDSDGKPDKAWPTPIHLISAPGENGAASIDLTTPGLKAYIFESDLGTKENPSQVVKEVETLCVEAVSGKRGPITTFAFDGGHKMYDLFWEDAFKGLQDAFGDKIPEEKLRGQAFGIAHKRFLDFVKKINGSAVPYVVFTFWTGRDRDNPDDPQNKSSHVWADLPGEMAKKIIGEFGCVLYAEPGMEAAPNSGKYTPGSWQTRKHGKVWGVGIKGPASVTAKVPTLVKQNWRDLERLVLGAEPQEEKA